MVEFKEYEGLGYFIDPESDTKQVFIPSPPTMATVKINPRPGIIYVTGGKVKEGYESRARYILGELNSALGTEYKMNDNIIQQYGELKDNIDELISKKKVEAALNAYKGEYETALKEQGEATKNLTELRRQYNDELKKTTKRI